MHLEAAAGAYDMQKLEGIALAVLIINVARLIVAEILFRDSSTIVENMTEIYAQVRKILNSNYIY